MNDPVLEMMVQGARMIATLPVKYTSLHREAGLSQAEWNVLVKDTAWTEAQRRAARTALSEAISASLTIAGLPPGRMPAEYVAAVIAEVVHPVNWLVACRRAPETYRGTEAVGIDNPMEIVSVSVEEMQALVMYYAANMVPQSRRGMDLPDGVEKEAVDA